MKLQIYDIRIDETRDVTQADVDTLQAVEQTYGRIRTVIADEHAKLLNVIEEIRRRYNTKPVDPAVTNPG